MIWYKVILTSSELTKGLDIELENDFKSLFSLLDEPEDMRLYRSMFLGDNHLFYYIQMPEYLGYDLGKVFNRYRTTFTTEPIKINLVLTIGYEAVQKTG